MILGQGPDATGGNNDFTDAIPCVGRYGCAVQKSTVVYRMASMFQSPKGIYQLSRAVADEYIGAEVESLLAVSSAAQSSLIMPDTTPDPSCLVMPDVVYDYLSRQWCAFRLRIMAR